MKSRILLLFSLFCWHSSLISQTSIDKILGEIEKNNTTLSALRSNITAEKIGNRTGLALQNPEFEFHYLWGDPTTIGNRIDINVKQTFDFPTAYVYKNQIANNRNDQSDIDYQKQRNSVLRRTRLILVDLIYANALQTLTNRRFLQAQLIADAYRKKMDAGEANILEFNKAQLFLLNLRKEAETSGINREALLSELASYNAGVPIDFSDTVYTYSIIPKEFDQWYQQSLQQIPELNLIKNEITFSYKQQQLSTALSLPKFSAGYMSEKVINQQLQGIIAGISIPLWENKNKVKFAKARTIALQSMEADRKSQLYNQLKTYHTKIIGLQKTVFDYQTSLQSFVNTELLYKALEKGEISLLEYILELSVYYSSATNLLETEKEINKTIVELYQYKQ